MLWINVLVGAVCGVLGAGVASLVVRNRAQNKRAYSTVLVVAMGGFFAAAKVYVTPQLQVWYETRQIEASFADNPALAAIKRYDPGTYRRVVTAIQDLLKQGRSGPEVIASIHGEIVRIVQQRLPHASDESAAAYMHITVMELAELQHQGGDLCFRFLYPQAGQPVDLSSFLSEATKNADLAALGEVVRTSAIAPQPIPKMEDVSAQLEPIFGQLASTFGNDLALLQNPAAPGVDRSKICPMVIELYSRILQLPPSQAGKAIRALLGSGQTG